MSPEEALARRPRSTANTGELAVLDVGTHASLCYFSPAFFFFFFFPHNINRERDEWGGSICAAASGENKSTVLENFHPARQVQGQGGSRALLWFDWQVTARVSRGAAAEAWRRGTVATQNGEKQERQHGRLPFRMTELQIQVRWLKHGGGGFCRQSAGGQLTCICMEDFHRDRAFCPSAN